MQGRIIAIVGGIPRIGGGSPWNDVKDILDEKIPRIGGDRYIWGNTLFKERQRL